MAIFSGTPVTCIRYYDDDLRLFLLRLTHTYFGTRPTDINFNSRHIIRSTQFQNS